MDIYDESGVIVARSAHPIECEAMPATPELLPCPFCGANDLHAGGDDRVVGYLCRNCEATGPNHYGKHEWNTRAAISQAEHPPHDAQPAQTRINLNDAPWDAAAPSVSDAAVAIAKKRFDELLDGAESYMGEYWSVLQSEGITGAYWEWAQCVARHRQTTMPAQPVTGDAGLREALEEVVGCFNGAYTEGLIERMAEQDNTDAGSLHDLVNRRIMHALYAAQRALKKYDNM